MLLLQTKEKDNFWKEDEKTKRGNVILYTIPSLLFWHNVANNAKQVKQKMSTVQENWPEKILFKCQKTTFFTKKEGFLLSLRFTPCTAEWPLQGMDLQENEEETD